MDRRFWLEQAEGEVKLALGFIRELYRVEADAKALGPAPGPSAGTGEASPRARQAVARRASRPRAPEEPDRGGGRLRPQWTALTRYAEDGDLAIDNNASELALRRVAVGGHRTPRQRSRLRSHEQSTPSS